MAYVMSLHDILRQANCNIEDIQAFLDTDNSSINEVDEDEDTPLFLSLRHSEKVIKLLLKNGADVSCRDMDGRSLLMNALKSGCEASVVKVLLEALDSTYVNELDVYYEIPPLLLAVRLNRSPTIIKLLLQFGAKIDFIDDNGYTPLSLALERLRDEGTVKLLVKYSVLKIPNFNINNFIQGNADYIPLARYAVQCAYEINQMNYVVVDGGRTLRQIVCEDSSPWRGVAEGLGELENVLQQLLQLRVDIIYPLYLDLISIKIGKQLMLEKLQEVVSYSVEHVHSVSELGKVLLHYGCVCNMAQLLSEEELLKLILAFYIPHD